MGGNTVFQWCFPGNNGVRALDRVLSTDSHLIPHLQPHLAEATYQLTSTREHKFSAQALVGFSFLSNHK